MINFQNFLNENINESNFSRVKDIKVFMKNFKDADLSYITNSNGSRGDIIEAVRFNMSSKIDLKMIKDVTEAVNGLINKEYKFDYTLTEINLAENKIKFIDKNKTVALSVYF